MDYYPPFDYVDHPPHRSASEEAPDMFNSDPPAFQLPPVFQLGPALANGGGVELLPGVYNQSTWVSNNVLLVQNKPMSKEKHVAHYDPVSYPTQQPTNITIAQSGGAFDFEDLLPAPVPSPARNLLSPSFQFDDAVFSQQQPITPSHRRTLEASTQQTQTQTQPQAHLELITPTTNLAPRFPGASANLPNLPFYSVTGFDAMSILTRVFNRPFPRVHLGPVDMSCSFVIVDTRRHDHPIVYCSPNFTKLTGYSMHETLGRNCRFLQAPNGVIDAAAQRPDPKSQSAAAHLKKNLTADKECQTIITNYRKDGTPFLNFVTVIPLTGGESNQPHEENDVVFHVGFQVDATEQPRAILENLQQGSYTTDYPQKLDVGSAGRAAGAHGLPGGVGRDRKSGQALAAVVVSKEMKKWLADPVFLRSISITTKTNFQPPVPTNGSANELDAVFGGNHPLHMLLLEQGPDFVHIVSLKGAFLYVAPSIRTVLGYQPEDLVGESLATIAHPEDQVPLMRELKESSTGVVAVPGADGLLGGVPGASAPRTVDLMFRARTKNGVHVWVESRGKLHLEPGKGRKAIILTGRAREMMNIKWEVIACGGGLAKPVPVEKVDEDGEMGVVQLRQEFWGTMSGGMTLITVGGAVKDVLGWGVDELACRNLEELMVDPAEAGALKENVERLGRVGEGEYDAMWTSARFRMIRKDGGSEVVVVNVFRCERDRRVRYATTVPGGIFPAHLMYQVRLASAEVLSLHHPASSSSAPPRDSSSSATSSSPSSQSSSSQPSSSTAPTSSSSSSGSSSISGPGYPDLKANVFQSLDVSRGSSWQYELQQLKFGNQRLMDEIAALQGAIKAAEAKRKAARAQEEVRFLPPSMVGGYHHHLHPHASHHAHGHAALSLLVTQQMAQQMQRGPGSGQQQFGGQQQQQPTLYQRRFAGLPRNGVTGSSGSGGYGAGNGDVLMQQSQQHHGGGMAGPMQPNLSTNLSYQATAALPMRTLRANGGNAVQGAGGASMQGSQQQGQGLSMYGSYGAGGGGTEYMGTSTFVQRVQEEVVAGYYGGGIPHHQQQYQQSRNGGGGGGGMVPMKRTWGVAQGMEEYR